MDWQTYAAASLAGYPAAVAAGNGLHAALSKQRAGPVFWAALALCAGAAAGAQSAAAGAWPGSAALGASALCLALMGLVLGARAGKWSAAALWGRLRFIALELEVDRGAATFWLLCVSLCGPWIACAGAFFGEPQARWLMAATGFALWMPLCVACANLRAQWSSDLAGCSALLEKEVAQMEAQAQRAEIAKAAGAAPEGGKQRGRRKGL